MNCKNFEAIISDLAREQMMDAGLRAGALSHIEECETCARMLEEERALTRELRSLSASMAMKDAPAHLEATLLAKFRERAAQTEEASPAVIEMPQRVSRWQRWYPQAAAAAVLLMFAIGGAAVISMRRGQQPASAQPGAVASSKSGSNQPVDNSPASSSANTPVTNTTGEIENPTIASADSDEGRAGQGQKLSRSEVAAIMGTNSQRRAAYQSVPKSSINRSRLAQTGGEIATDFMPVSYGDNLNDIENGRIIRVEMPRSALAQFGLPVNMERANERVKADVLIGDDGMARAIRFVR